MFITAITAQIKLLLKQAEAQIVFLLLLVLCLLNFVNNVWAFQGKDLIAMYHPMKLLLLSYNRVYYNADATLFFIQLYPILVVCPAGFSLVKEQHTKQEALIASRIGLRTYRFSKLIASFAVTTLVFMIPFVVEMLLNCIAFPLEAAGDLLNWGFYSEEYMNSVQHYFMKSLFLKAPYLYTFLCILFFSVVSGVLGTFVVAFSSLFRMKYKVFLFMPVYFLLNATLYLDAMFPGIQTNWYNYILIFHDENKSYGYFWTSLLLCVLFILGAAFFSSKKDLIE